ncbi:hypothetical protein [Paucilactobacillus hokkaidonensis]
MERLAVGHLTSVGLTEISTARKKLSIIFSQCVYHGWP